MKKLPIVIGCILIILSTGFFISRDREKIVEKVISIDEQCAMDMTAQAHYLEDEKYFEQYSFDNYKVPSEKLEAVGYINDSPFAREFKTRLTEEVASHGVNFARHYSLVSVGMTGWGNNFWIVNKKTGTAYEFPYYANSLEFEKGSNLIVMNSKESIQTLLEDQPEGGCYFLNQQKVTDLRPFYFKWENDSLTLLAPVDIEPPINTFWIDYFSDIPEGTPSYITHFIRNVKEQVIRHFGKVPQNEGYTGPDMLETFPGLIPKDFLGVSTQHGEYFIEKGKLQYFGNEPDNALAIDTKGMTLILENVSRRLKMPNNSEAAVDKIIEAISK
jgi:hypothetical protein